MKKILLTALILFSATGAFCETITVPVKTVSAKAKLNTPASTVVRPDYTSCHDTFGMNTENLFYLALGALNKMNFKVREIQSKTGTILFTAASKEFLITIAKTDAGHSFMKILPTDNNYSFSPTFTSDIFKLIKSEATAGITAL